MSTDHPAAAKPSPGRSPRPARHGEKRPNRKSPRQDQRTRGQEVQDPCRLAPAHSIYSEPTRLTPPTPNQSHNTDRHRGPHPSPNAAPSLHYPPSPRTPSSTPQYPPRSNSSPQNPPHPFTHPTPKRFPNAPFTHFVKHNLTVSHTKPAPKCRRALSNLHHTPNSLFSLVRARGTPSNPRQIRSSFDFYPFQEQHSASQRPKRPHSNTHVGLIKLYNDRAL